MFEKNKHFSYKDSKSSNWENHLWMDVSFWFIAPKFHLRSKPSFGREPRLRCSHPTLRTPASASTEVRGGDVFGKNRGGSFYMIPTPKVHGTILRGNLWKLPYMRSVLVDFQQILMNLMTTAWKGKILKGNFIFQTYIFRCFCCYCQAGIGFLYSLCITSLDGIVYILVFRGQNLGGVWFGWLLPPF